MISLTSAQRRALAARGNRIKASVTIADTLSDSVVAHVRKAFGKRDLIKVRIATEDREVFAQTAAELAERIPCVLVQRIGRIALLYRPIENADEDS